MGPGQARINVRISIEIECEQDERCKGDNICWTEEKQDPLLNTANEQVIIQLIMECLQLLVTDLFLLR